MNPVLEREGTFTRRKRNPGNEAMPQGVTELAQPCKLTSGDSLTRFDLECQDLAVVVLDDQIYLVIPCLRASIRSPVAQRHRLIEPRDLLTKFANHERLEEVSELG